MEDEYAGFRRDGRKIMKGSKAIGEVDGKVFRQDKTYPRHYLRKRKGFGVSLGLLKLLKDNGVYTFVIDVVSPKKELITVVSADVDDLIDSDKVQYPGFDEQRLFGYEPELLSNVGE